MSAVADKITAESFGNGYEVVTSKADGGFPKESALLLLKRSEPDPELKMATHYKDRWRGTPNMIGREDLARRREQSSQKSS
jgi:hypothetical protein